MNFLDKLVAMISWRISQVGQVALVAVMLLIAGNVIIRAIWTPVPGTVEMTELLGAIILGLGVAYCQQMKGHIFVSVLVNRLSQRKQAIIDTATTILAVFFTSLLAWRIMIYAARMAERGYTTGHLSIPIYPFIYLVGIGFIILALVLVRDLLKSIILIKKGSEQ